MIAAIRVRFTPTPASQVWSDTLFSNWLNSTIPFSLANFWFQSSFGQADLNFQIFPPIVMDDPRLQLSAEQQTDNAYTRSALVNAAVAQITALYKPDWSVINSILIWYAQNTDLFGGGAFAVPGHSIPAAVVSIGSEFDAMCQELGHLYGLQHPLNSTSNPYGDPYDSMASETYNGYSAAYVHFQRAVNAALPVGSGNPDPQRLAGPYLSAAHLAVSPWGPNLRNTGLFINVPASYRTGAASFYLYALDRAVDRYPSEILPIVAIVPPTTPGGTAYYLELRWSAGYDNGLQKQAGDTLRPPIGIVIHSYDPTVGVITYVGTFPLLGNRGDRDYHMFGGGDFTFHVTSVGEDYRWAAVTIGGMIFGVILVLASMK